MSAHEWGRSSRDDLGGELSDNSVAVLPLGAIEQHGPHLPLATDQIIAEGLARKALDQCARTPAVWLLPTMPFGQGLEHAGHPGTLALSAATLESMLIELGASAAAAGLRRLVLFSGHGGNHAAIDNAALRLRHDHQLLVVKACYFDFAMPTTPPLPPREWREGLHGGALETALMQYFQPDLVAAEALAHWPSIDTTALAEFSYLGAEHGAGRFAWLASDLNPEGVVGDARLATAAMGEAFAEHYAGILAGVISETAQFPLACLHKR